MPRTDAQESLPDAEKSGVEDAPLLVGLVALGAELRVLVVPAPELFAVRPHLREDGHGAAVHEAGDALVVGERARLLRAGLDGVALGDTSLHEARPALGEAHDASTVPVRVRLERLLPAVLVADRHLLRGTGERVVERTVVVIVLLLGLFLPLLVLRGVDVLLVAAVALVVELLDERRCVVTGVRHDLHLVEGGAGGLARPVGHVHEDTASLLNRITNHGLVLLHFVSPIEEHAAFSAAEVARVQRT